MSVLTSKVAAAADLGVRIRPETPNLGAIVEGVNAKEPLNPELVALIKDALMRYKVLFFRDQHLSEKQQRDFTLNFGEPFRHPIRQYDYEEDRFSDITMTPYFHSDTGYLPELPWFSVLQMLELPEVGGDTIWADLVSSYNELSQSMKDFIDPLYGVNTKLEQAPIYEKKLLGTYKQEKGEGAEELTPEQLEQIRDSYTTTEHPLVRVIPDTGAKNYFLSEWHTQSIVGLSKEESDALLGVLFRHQLHPRFCYRYRWAVGDSPSGITEPRCTAVSLISLLATALPAA